MEFEGGIAGFGKQGKPDFWIAARGEPQTGIHIAIVSADRASVDRFHEAALAAGGTDNGPPGRRPLYHEHYYGAYVLDPDGNNVEAVCHAPE
jgi:catechol 2,3-dioxygenase-like lactoylglutathione lyase family enzyme